MIGITTTNDPTPHVKARGRQCKVKTLAFDSYIVTPPEAIETVKEALVKAGITLQSAEVAMVPQNYVKLTGEQAKQMLRLIEALEEHDDVQHVYANFDIDESEIQAAVGAS